MNCGEYTLKRVYNTPLPPYVKMSAINHLLYLIITSGPTLYMSHEINRREKKTVFLNVLDETFLCEYKY